MQISISRGLQRRIDFLKVGLPIFINPYHNINSEHTLDKRMLPHMFLKVLRFYAGFALLHTAIKVLFGYLKRRRANFLWKNLPGQEIDSTGRNMLAHKNDLHKFFSDACKNYPEAHFVRLPTPRPMLVANSPRSIKWMLKDEFDNISKRGDGFAVAENFKELLGSKCFFSMRNGVEFPKEHNEWLVQRKNIKKFITKRSIESEFCVYLEKKTVQLIDIIEECADKKEVFDLQHLFMAFFMDIIENMILGTKVDGLKEKKLSSYGQMFAKGNKLSHDTFFEYGKYYALARLLPFPFGNLLIDQKTTQNLIIQSLRRWNEDFKSRDNAFKDVEKYVSHCYDRTLRAKPSERGNDFLSKLITDGRLEKDQIVDALRALTLAGRDTTSTVISWMFCELARNREKYEKVLEEIDEKLQGRTPGYEDLSVSNMPYLNAVFWETLRMHPVVPTTLKAVAKELVFDDIVIPRGTTVIISTLHKGYNEKVFPQPECFKPERWIPFVQPSEYELPVFYGGPRICMGKDLAIFQVKFLAIRIMQKLLISIKPGDEKIIRRSAGVGINIANDKDGRNVQFLCLAERRQS